MKTRMTSGLVTVCMGVWFVAMTQVHAASDWSGAASCTKGVNPDQVKTVLTLKQQDQTVDAYGIYAESCNGILYLLDLRGSKTMWPINESWWFDTLSSADWKQPGDATAIVVEASYITGIGPTGVEPFWARIQLNQVGGAWVPTEPEWIDMPKVEPKFDGELWVAKNQTALNKLLAREFTDLDAVQVDFDTSRFVIGSVWLTSGSMRITDVWVTREKDAYEIHYDTTGPTVGTTDMRHHAIYAVVPKDDLPVRLASRSKKSGHRIHGQAGFLERGQLKTK